VVSGSKLLPRDREPKLERHVESRGTRGLTVKFHSGEIMEGVTTTSDQGEDSVQAPLPTGDFKRGTWNQTEATDSGNVGEVQLAKCGVVRDVEEYAGPRAGQAVNYAGRFAAWRSFAHSVIGVWKHGGGPRWGAPQPCAQFPLRGPVKPPSFAPPSSRSESACRLQLPSACLPCVYRLQLPSCHDNVNQPAPSFA
jgi:hypothetical protein